MTDDTALIRACAGIMGYTFVQGQRFWYVRDHSNHNLSWNPLTDEDASAALLERMVELGWEVVLIYMTSVSLWNAEFNGDRGEFCHRGPDRKRAIAEAAVKCFGKGEE